MLSGQFGENQEDNRVWVFNIMERKYSPIKVYYDGGKIVEKPKTKLEQLLFNL